MGADTKIQWAHHTFNPWIGCAKVSAGCKHCYAEVQTYPRVSKARGLPLWGENAARLWADAWAASWNGADSLGFEWAQNIWLGTTVESQAMADERIPHLLRVPARVRFLSCEPLLERVNLHRWLCKHATDNQMEQRWMSSWCDPSGSISWVIIGGESGPKARPCAEEWIGDLVEQCLVAEVPAFVKQLGSKWAWAAGLFDRAGGDPAEWPEELCVREFPAGATR